MGITVKLNTAVLERLPGDIQRNATNAVRESAAGCRDFANQISPVRTGALKASWYVSGPNEESDYSQHAGSAHGLNPLAIILEEARASLVEPSLSQPVAIISSAVNYSIFIEEGTRYMAPQPVLRPASEQARNVFVEAMKKVAG